MKARTKSKHNKYFLEDFILLPLKQHGFHIFETCYYTRHKNIDSLEFRIKEIPEIKFGVWLDYGDMFYVLFGEFDVWNDKFKPTQTQMFDSVWDLIRILYSFREIKSDSIADAYEYMLSVFSHHNESYESFISSHDELKSAERHNHVFPNEVEFCQDRLNEIIKFALSFKEVDSVVINYKPDIFRVYVDIDIISNYNMDISDEDGRIIYDKIMCFINSDVSTRNFFNYDMCDLFMNPKWWVRKQIYKKTKKCKLKDGISVYKLINNEITQVKNYKI